MTEIRSWLLQEGDLDDDARRVMKDAIRYVDDVEYAERAKKQPSGRSPRASAPARARQGARR